MYSISVMHDSNSKISISFVLIYPSLTHVKVAIASCYLKTDGGGYIQEIYSLVRHKLNRMRLRTKYYKDEPGDVSNAGETCVTSVFRVITKVMTGIPQVY